MDQIHLKKVKIGGYKTILIHMGTNNVDPSSWSSRVTMERRAQEIRYYFDSLISAVRLYNRSAIIIFAAILPRLCDWYQTKQLVFKVNGDLKKLCQRRRCWYDTTYSEYTLKGREVPFSQKGDPIPGLFDKKDGLHLSIPGAKIFTRQIMQLVSDTRIREIGVALHW